MLSSKDLSPYVVALNAAYQQLVDSEDASSVSLIPEIRLPGNTAPITPRSGNLMYHQCRHKLAEASESLQEALRGKDSSTWPVSTPDYKRIAQDTTRALDAVTRMLQSDMHLLRSVNLIPAAEIETRTNLLRTLAIEAREKFGLPPSAVFSSIEVSGCFTAPAACVPTPSPVPRLFGPKPTLFTSMDDDTSVAQSGETSARAVLMGKGNQQAAADGKGPAIDPSEMYDARLMFPGNEWRSTEADDQCEQLRQSVAQLTLEKEQLASQVEQLSSQLDSTRELLEADANAALKVNERVEADMRNLSSALGIPYGVNAGDDVVESPQPEDEAPPSPSKDLVSEGVQVSLPRMDAVPSTPQRPSTTGTQLDASPVSTIRGLSPYRSPIGASADTPSNRYHRLERLYADVYKGRGMELVWNAVDTVYRCEYDDKSADATEDERVEMYTRFQGDFEREVSSVIGNPQAFSDMVQGVTPLRSDYVANCLSHRVKANSGIVTLLSHFKSDRAVRELSLQGNYIGDQGVLPLLPVLARMHNLTELNLANNGIRNDGARHLCRALASHPSLCRIDLSHNAIARAGGKDILSLVNTCPRITGVSLEGTAMDPALRTRIEERASTNANSK